MGLFSKKQPVEVQVCGQPFDGGMALVLEVVLAYDRADWRRMWAFSFSSSWA